MIAERETGREEKVVNVNPEEFRRHFEMLSDDALLAVERGDFVVAAQQCYDEECARRGLTPGQTKVVSGEVQTVEPVDEVDALVQIATYLSGDEAGLARGLLHSAGIPAVLANPLAIYGNPEIHLSVPESFVDHALEILGHEISDEELAAQAEAAGESSEEEFPE
jgi:hypothetical protein